MTSAPLAFEAALERLDAAQRDVVESTESRLFVDAAPGSGKTLVLALRFARLIREGADPRKMRALVFARSAAQTLRARLAAYVGGEVADLVDVATFASFAVRVSGVHGLEVASDELVDAAIGSLYAGPLRRPPRTLPTVTDLRAALEAVAALESPALPPLVAHAVDVVDLRLASAGAAGLWRFMREAAPGGAAEATSVDHVAVDESQDCTPLDARLALLGLHTPRTFFAVGDRNQAIFGWRHADRDCLRASFYNAGTAALSRSYRFGDAIAAHARRIMPEATLDADGPGSVSFHDCNAPGGPLTVDLIAGLSESLAMDRDRFRQVAVLCRTNDEVRQIAAYAPSILFPITPGSGADLFALAAQENRAPVATVHAAKGREWDHVILHPSLDGGGSKTDEDRRVRYVAATRARRSLSVCIDERTTAP